MNQQRLNHQRHAVAPLPRPRPSNAHQPDSNGSARVDEEVSLAMGDRSAGRVRNPRNNNSSQANVINSQGLKDKFEQACEGFFYGLVILQALAAFFFLVLTLVTQVWDADVEDAKFPCFGLSILNTVIRFFFMFAYIGEFEKRLIFVYQFFEAGVILAMFVLWISDESTGNVLAIFYVLLGSYIIRMIYSYKINKFENNKFVNDINKTVLVLRAIILIQVPLVLVQLFLEKPMSWFIALIPTWIFVLVLIAFTVNLIKGVYSVSDDGIWDVNTWDKKKGAIWILANLVILIVLMIYISILVGLVLDGHVAESGRPFLGPFIAVVAWCAISLAYAYKEDATIKDFMSEVGLALEADRNTQNAIMYVIKISNTFFKGATKRDIKHIDSNKPWKAKVAKDPEVKASLKRMPTESVNCMICYESVSNGVFMDCGHGGVCFECGQDIKKTKKECHMCRTKIKSLLKIDMNVRNTTAVYYKIVKWNYL